jgi:6-pyruvoyl tetrahydropterin synthase-like protein
MPVFLRTRQDIDYYDCFVKNEVMKYELKVEKSFRAVQGLRSPIRNVAGLASKLPPEGYEITLVAGVVFDDSQLNQRGWFVDSDAVAIALEAIGQQLASKKWTEQFDFRPTFELVAKWVFEQLEEKIDNLSYIELASKTLEISVTYSK